MVGGEEAEIGERHDVGDGDYKTEEDPANDAHEPRAAPRGKARFFVGTPGAAGEARAPRRLVERAGDGLRALQGAERLRAARLFGVVHRETLTG